MIQQDGLAANDYNGIRFKMAADGSNRAVEVFFRPLDRSYHAKLNPSAPYAKSVCEVRDPRLPPPLPAGNLCGDDPFSATARK